MFDTHRHPAVASFWPMVKKHRSRPPSRFDRYASHAWHIRRDQPVLRSRSQRYGFARRREAIVPLMYYLSRLIGTPLPRVVYTAKDLYTQWGICISALPPGFTNILRQPYYVPLPLDSISTYGKQLTGKILNNELMNSDDLDYARRSYGNKRSRCLLWLTFSMWQTYLWKNKAYMIYMIKRNLFTFREIAL